MRTDEKNIEHNDEDSEAYMENIRKSIEKANQRTEELVSRANSRPTSNKQESEIKTRDKELESIINALNLPDTGKLYYPACGGDTSPSIAFRNWDVTYLDSMIDVYSEGEIWIKDFSKLNPEHINLIKGDLTKPPFDKNLFFDIVLIASPGSHFRPEEVITPSVQNLKKDGLLICDNYHWTANYVLKYMEDKFEKIRIDNLNEFTVFKKKN